MIDLEQERKDFEKCAFQASSGWASFGKDSNGKYWPDKLNLAWDMWLKRAERENEEIEALKAKLAKVESAEFVMVPKSEIGNYYFDDSECIYLDEPDCFLSELDIGEVCEVKRRDYFDLPTQYAAKVFVDEGFVEWRLFDSELEAEIAANECKDKFWGEQGDGDE